MELYYSNHMSKSGLENHHAKDPNSTVILSVISFTSGKKSISMLHCIALLRLTTW